MRIRALIALFFAFGHALAEEDDQVSPISRQELMVMVEQRLAEDRFIAEVHRRGLGFGLTLEDLEAVRAAGYSLDLMLVLARAGRATVAVDNAVVEAEEAEEKVFITFANVAQDLSLCHFRAPPGLSQAQALEAVWAAFGGIEALRASRQRVGLAASLASLGFPVTACGLIRDIGEESTLDNETIGCLVATMERIGALGLECPVSPGAAWLRADSSGLAPNVFDRFHYLVGRVLFEAGVDPQRALQHLMSVRRQATDFPRARLLQAILEARLGRPRQGLRLLSTLTGLRERGPDGVSIRELALLNMGRIAYQSGFYEEALARYREIPTASRLWVDATYERAWAALAGGYYAEALGSVVALRSPLVRPRIFHDAWVVEAATLQEHCMFEEAARYARAWIGVLDRRIQAYEQLLPGIGRLAQKCPPDCTDGDEIVKPQVVAKHFARVIADPWVYALHRTAIAATREDRILGGLARTSPILFGLDAVSQRAADLAIKDFQAALVQAVVADFRSLVQARARGIDVLVDLDQEALEAHYGAARAMAEEGSLLPVPLILREVERMAREGLPAREMKLFLAMNGKARALTDDELAALRHAGVPAEVLDFARRFFGKPGPTRFEVDPTGEDPRLLWGFEGEFWTDEMVGLRVEIVDRCRALAPKVPPGLR